MPRSGTLLLVAWVVVVLSTLVPVPAAGSSAPTFSVGLSATPSYGPAPLWTELQTTVSAGTPQWYNWSFGDGSSADELAPSVGAAVYHNYTSVGKFTVNVTVYEPGESASASVVVTVNPAPLDAHALASRTSGVAPLNVVFTGSASGGTGTYPSLLWSLGDGATGSGSPVTETFQQAGHYHVELNVTDSGGVSAFAYLWVNVSAAPCTNCGGGSSSGLPGWAELLGVALVGLLVGMGIVLLWRGRRREPSTGAGSLAAPPEVFQVEPSAPLAPPASPSPPVPLEPLGPPPPSPPGPPTETASPPAPPASPPPSPPPARTDLVTAPESPSAPQQTMAATGSWAEPSSEPAPPRATAPSSSPSPEALRISERIVLSLGSQGRLGEDDVAPVAFTQSGMAEALGIRQNSLTNVLRRLEAAGVVTVDVRHVRGRDRRMKVYRLTARGEALAHDLQRRARAK